MSRTSQTPEEQGTAGHTLRRLGVVVHPARTITGPLRALTRWAEQHGVDVVQIPVPGQERVVAKPGAAADCDLIVSIGGDGTMLAAIRAAFGAGRPALGLACGSLGVLTAIEAEGLDEALERFARGEWQPRRLPALAITLPGSDPLLAINDIAIVRGGIGQVRVTSRVDGILFSRLAGDGCIVSTPLGSSAYSLAAGSALLSPDTEAYLLTPLATHGGSRHPLVVSAGSELQLDVHAGIGGARLEVDGQAVDGEPRGLTIRLRREVATVVTYADEDPLFVSLRRRQIIVDSPRIIADDGRG
ncbi:MAG TPA: NAD(+)/NADH kinase [Solirubrobacteraceae bacterium]|jgi:NAD+ kinase|nr:NAD(+)/NADH kinase [Solirubrobacteraceae bacterium]